MIPKIKIYPEIKNREKSVNLSRKGVNALVFSGLLC